MGCGQTPGLAHLTGFWDDLGISGIHPTSTLIFPSRPGWGARGISAGRTQERYKGELPGDSNHQTWMEWFQKTQRVESQFSKVLSSVPAPAQIGNSGRVPRNWSLLTGVGFEALRVILRPE